MQAIIAGSAYFRNRALLAPMMGDGNSRVEFSLSFELALHTIVSEGDQLPEIATYQSSHNSRKRTRFLVTNGGARRLPRSPPKPRGDRVIELHHHDERDAPVGAKNAERSPKCV